MDAYIDVTQIAVETSKSRARVHQLARQLGVGRIIRKSQRFTPSEARQLVKRLKNGRVGRPRGNNPPGLDDLSILTERQWEVAIGYWHEGKTMATLAEEMKISRERVRQLRNQARRKLHRRALGHCYGVPNQKADGTPESPHDRADE